MPRYEHDCDGCEYLGEHENYDLYYCANCDGGTVIARYSDEGSEYASTPLSMMKSEHRAFLKANPDYAAGQALLKAQDLLCARYPSTLVAGDGCSCGNDPCPVIEKQIAEESGVE